jgi:hypothetical protein
MTKLRVLLLGECASPHSPIAQRLATWDVDCQFANSYSEARELFKHHAFRLVISKSEGRLGVTHSTVGRLSHNLVLFLSD